MTDIARIVRHHHERFDGRGYPDRLVGDDIPLGARIISVADAFSAMTNDRVYRKAIGARAGLGGDPCATPASQFDPALVELFEIALRWIGRKKRLARRLTPTFPRHAAPTRWVRPPDADARPIAAPEFSFARASASPDAADQQHATDDDEQDRPRDAPPGPVSRSASRR